MKRVLIGFFVVLFLFLTSGYSQLLAQSWRDARALDPSRHLTAGHNDAPQGKFIVEKEPAEGEEDSNTTTARKYLDFGDIFFAFENFASQTVLSVQAGKPITSFIAPGNRYITLQVFRL